MVRASRIWPNVYLGKPGALTTLPWPRGDMDRQYERLTADFVTNTGQHLVTMSPQGSRLYTLNWNSLHGDSYGLLSQYWSGMMGVGPWAFIDPSANNLLMPNQASATSNMNDATGVQTLTGSPQMGTVLSNSSASFIHRTGGTRSIQWQWPTAASGTPTLCFTPPYRNWFGIPVVVGLPYAWSIWAMPDGVVDTSVTCSARIQWLNAAGTQIQQDTSGDSVLTTWGKLTVSVNAPVGAYYARPVLITNSATITTGASVYADEPLFEQDSVFNSWAPGTGCRPVEITGLTDPIPFDAKWRKGITLNLRELVQ